MRKKYIFGKKLYISVLTSILVLLTTVATTFAWVGVFANSTFEQFNFNVKSSSLIEYGMEISSTGKKGTFSDSLDEYDIKRQILVNWGFDEDIFLKNENDKIVNNKESINRYFSSLNLDQCTTLPEISGGKLKKLGGFKNLYGEATNSIFKFDIYISPVQFYDSGKTSEFKLDSFIQPNMILGSYREVALRYIYKFPSEFINPYSSLIEQGKYTLPTGVSLIDNNTSLNSIRCNSQSAGRVAFEKYEVVEKGKPEEYTNSSLPISALIYSGDKYDYPVYDQENDLYEFGGILANGSNFSVDYFNETDYYFTTGHPIDVPTNILTIRGPESNTRDLILTSKTNHIIDSTNPNEQIGIGQMMKITCYFWFEGWDADCWKGINKSPVTINISFSMLNEEEF